ncbi:MAG: archease [Dehalococcoidales bacterium]
MAGDYEIVDHTADVAIVARGADVGEAFASAGRALLSLITDPDSVAEVEERRIELSATDLKDLLVAWLNELIYLFDAENLLLSGFDVRPVGDTGLVATARGERVDKTRHRIKLGVKAATHHMLEIDRDNGVRLQVLFDV